MKTDLMLGSTYNNSEVFPDETATYSLSPGHAAAGSPGISLSLSPELFQ